MDLSVLVVEDHPLVARAMVDDLQSETALHVRVVGTAHEAERMLADASLDWFRILLDLDIPGAHGLSLARRIAATPYRDRCCVVTAADQPQLIAEAKDLGLLGYIPKTSPYLEFRAALARSGRQTDLSRAAG